MPYPFVFAHDGAEFARINHDGSWSILWDQAREVASKPLTARNVAIVACAKIFVLVENRIHSLPWADSDACADKWNHYSKMIDVRMDECGTNIEFEFPNGGIKCAKLFSNATWEFDWDEISVVSGEPMDWRRLSLVAMCRLFMVARPYLQAAPDIEEIDEISDDFDENSILQMWDEFSQTVRNGIKSVLELFEGDD